MATVTRDLRLPFQLQSTATSYRMVEAANDLDSVTDE